MNLLNTFRKKLAFRYLDEHIPHRERVRKQINLNNARNIALLYYLPEEDAYKKVEALLSQLASQNYRVRVVCYSPLKYNPPYFIPKLLQDCINAKDLNWKYQPQKAFVQEFIDTEFDILIDLSLQEHLPLIYLAGMSKASLKVGKYNERLHECYDLMIEIGEDENIETFAEQIIHYLQRINT